jgi:hypothetical protein
MNITHHKLHTYTCTYDWKIQNQIDSLVIDKRRRSSICVARSFREADCDSDLYLVIAKLIGRGYKQVNEQCENLLWRDVMSGSYMM